MRNLIELLIKLAVGGLTEEERRVGWKLVTTIGYRAVMVGLMLWGYGWLQFMGWGNGFARADDVDEKIKEAVKPLFAAQTRQGEMLKAFEDLLNEQLASGVATEIRYLVGMRCKGPDAYERERIQKEIDRKQEEYKRFRDANEKYHYTCGDV